MSPYQFTLGCILFLVSSPRAFGHGTPIHVEVPASQLIVSQGIPDDGYASLIFAEDDDDGLPVGQLSLPDVDSVVLWNLPGLDIFGMNDQANLSIEVLLRPVRGTNPIERRLVWYWNPQSEEVEPSAASFHLLDSTTNHLTLPGGEATASLPPLLLADPIDGQQGFHNHSLLYYALDDNQDAPEGAYGLFARLKSNLYEPSDPFLLVFNHGMAYDNMLTAARAINFASDNLPGDFNRDGIVDAADFVVWRDTLSGEGAKYDEWEANFGAGSAVLEAAVPTAVPEPRLLCLLVITLGSLLCFGCRQRRRV